MATTEFRRHSIRVSANFVKLLSTLLLGIALVPVLLNWVGSVGFGLITLISTATGLSGLLREVIERSMIREIGAAMHSGDRGRFERAYASAFAVCLSIVPGVILVFVGIYALLPLLDIPPELLGAARTLVIAEACTNVLFLAVAPASNMYVIRERFVAYNAWAFCSRLAYLSAALFAWLVLDITDTARAVSAFGILTAIGTTLVNMAFVLALVARDRQLIPKPSKISRTDFREIVSLGGWNAGMTIAVAILHERMPQFVLNIAFGLNANAAFAIAQRLSSYVRMISLGVTSGLESVALRASATTLDIRRLTADITRFNAVATLPALTVVAILPGPLINKWVGRSVEEGSRIVPDAVLFTVIMLVPVITRAFSDIWTGVLYGTGHLKAYAPQVILTSFVTPVLALLMLWILPEGSTVRYASPVLAYVISYTAVHALWIPAIAAEKLGVRVRELFEPIFRPLVACALATPVLVAARILVEDWTLPRVGFYVMAFGLVYVPLVWKLAMKAHERERILSVVYRRP